VSGLPGAVWEARVLRISEAIDATRQTLGIVVGVDNPYQKIIPGVRPPLL
jgi:multidrug efflux pump subunit AcrA (membrane-fusion protein)